MEGQEDAVSRRDVLAKGALLGGAVIGGYMYRDRIIDGAADAAELLYRMSRRPGDTSLDGLPDRLKDSDTFHQYIEETFDTTFDGLDPDRKDLLIDARYVEGETFPDDAKTYIEDLFGWRTDITLHWLDYPETYTRDTFITDHEHRPAEILWRDGGFYDEEVEDMLKDTALQVVFAPGAQDDGHDGQLYCEPGEEYVAGFSAVNRSVVGSVGTAEDRTKTTLHEIAHLGNYHHNYDDPQDRGVLGQNEVTDLTPAQWDRLQDRLYMVSLELPGQVYDAANEYAACEDVVLPFK